MENGLRKGQCYTLEEVKEILNASTFTQDRILEIAQRTLNRIAECSIEQLSKEDLLKLCEEYKQND